MKRVRRTSRKIHLQIPIRVRTSYRLDGLHDSAGEQLLVHLRVVAIPLPPVTIIYT